MNFDLFRTRFFAVLVPGILTWFVISDFMPDKTVSFPLLLTWIGVCAGMTTQIIEAWVGKRRNGGGDE